MWAAIGDAPIAARRDLGHGRVTIEAEERHGSGEHAAALVLRLVQHLARGTGDDGMRAGLAEMRRGHHRPQGLLERMRRIGEEVGDAAQRLVLFHIEDMQDCADQQRMGGFLPVIAALQRALRIDQDVSDVLDVADLMDAAANFQQRVVGRTLRIGRIEQQAMGELCAPSGGQRPILTFDVVDDGRMWPGHQRGYDQADALAGPRRGEGHDVLRAVMAQIGAVHQAEEDARLFRQTGISYVFAVGPAGGAVGGDVLGLPRAPDRAGDCRQCRGDAAASGDGAAGAEDVRRISLIDIPPLEQPPRVIERKAINDEPGLAKTGLKAELEGDPLRREPCAGKRDAEHNQHLSDEHLRRRHSRPATAPQIGSCRRPIRHEACCLTGLSQRPFSLPRTAKMI